MDYANPIAALKKYKIPHREEDKWIKVASPFTDDTEDDLLNAHGGINKQSGVFNCFKSSKSMPLLAFLGVVTGKSIPVLQKEMQTFYEKSPIEDITDAHIELWTNLLLGEDSGEYLEAIKRKGLTPDTIIKYRLGLNQSGRITIPVYSVDNILLNVRRYDVLGRSKIKYTHPKGGETKAIYLPQNLNSDEVFIAGGEIKAINLSEAGFPAVSLLIGEKEIPPKFLNQFRGKKKVYIVYDVDEAGKRNAIKLANRLVRIVDEVFIVYLQDVAHIDGGDITDYFHVVGKTSEDFRQLLDILKPYNAPIQSSLLVINDLEEPVGEIALNKAIDAAYHQRMVKTSAIVSAKDTQPYTVPRKVEVCCPKTGQECCALCPFSMDKADDYTVTIPKSDPRVLSFLECGEEMQNKHIMEICRIPKQCKLVAFARRESMNVEVLRAIPQTAVGHVAAQSDPKTVYYLGHGLETNIKYDFKGRSVTEPRTQRSTLLITDANRSESDIDTFHLEHDLRCFQPSEWTVDALSVRLDDLYEDLENNVTGIFCRRDMHVVVDLVFHSVLYFRFQKKQIKGWADILVIGDSGQGKSETAMRLKEHYKVGEKVDTKRATVAGLVGGAQQTNKRWFISWGTIPLNDRRAVILEEVKGAPEEVLAKLTDMRSSGVADIQMVERARTNARTRLLWITNPRSSRNIRDYNYGTDTILELMGSKEDIRRFDMAMAVGTGEVSEEIYNGMGYEDIEHFFTSDLCNHLVLWAWSRRPEQIEIEREAEKHCLEVAMKLSKRYSSSIPLVEPADQRHKIMRLATALAARTFSTEDGEILIVRKCHVEYIDALLRRVYDSETLGYRDYSKSRFTEASISDDDAVKTEIQSLPNNRSLVEAMLYSDHINWNDFADYCDFDREQALITLGILVRNGCLKKVRRGGYRKTPAFIELLKSMLKNNEVQDGLVKQIGEV